MAEPARKLTVNLETCGRTGMCVFRYPKLFEEDEGGFPVVLVDDVDSLSAQEIDDILQCCPTGSISVKDAGGS
jgi:ferredoxin